MLVNGADMPDGGFMHPALFYTGLEDYLSGVGGFIRDGLDAEAPVFVAVPPQRLTVLREHLGVDAGRVRWVNMAEAGRNPGRILTALTDFAALHNGSKGGSRASSTASSRARLVGEPIWASRSAAEIREATRHEALINLAFAGVPATILCPYDVSGLSPATLAGAERTHPVLWNARRRVPYTDPMSMNAQCDAMAEVEPADAERMAFGPAELHVVRGRVAEFGCNAGLGADRVVDFKQAVGEAMANAIRYGGGLGKLSLWRDRDGRDRDSVVAEIRDSGRLATPLAGRRRPAADAIGGRGLWLIHQLCDLVEFGPGMLRLHISVAG